MQQGSSPGCHAPPWGGHHARLCQRRGCLCRAAWPVPARVLVPAGGGTGSPGAGQCRGDRAGPGPHDARSQQGRWVDWLCSRQSPSTATHPGAVPIPWTWGWHQGQPTGSCRRPRLPALPPATWAGGWRGGHACRVPIQGHCGPGGLLLGEQSSGCSCPVSHLYPCPLACCRGVIFAEECAVPSDSGRLQGLCYRREAETWGLRVGKYSTATWGCVMGQRPLPPPRAAQCSLCPSCLLTPGCWLVPRCGGTGKGLAASTLLPALLPASPPALCMQPLSPRQGGCRERGWQGRDEMPPAIPLRAQAPGAKVTLLSCIHASSTCSGHRVLGHPSSGGKGRKCWKRHLGCP